MDDEYHCDTCKRLFNTPVPQEANSEMLYGSSANEITALENAVQANYVKFIFTEKSTIWPSIMFQVNILGKYLMHY